MKTFALYIAAVLLGLALCAAGCHRDEPAEAPNRRPALPPAEADPGRDPVPEPEPGDTPSNEEWLAMAAEAARQTFLTLYYAPYQVSSLLTGRLSEAFEGRDARYLMIVGYEGSEERFTRYPAERDRWNLFFGDRADALELVRKIADYEKEAATRPLYPEEEAQLAAMKRELAAEEREALSEFFLVLMAEVEGRRFPLDTLGAGILLSAVPPPAFAAR